MRTHREKPPDASAGAERLLAHARLCEQVAQDCRNEAMAAELRRMARDCAEAAARMVSAGESPGHPKRSPGTGEFH